MKIFNKFCSNYRNIQTAHFKKSNSQSDSSDSNLKGAQIIETNCIHLKEISSKLIKNQVRKRKVKLKSTKGNNLVGHNQTGSDKKIYHFPALPTRQEHRKWNMDNFYTSLPNINLKNKIGNRTSSTVPQSSQAPFTVIHNHKSTKADKTILTDPLKK